MLGCKKKEAVPLTPRQQRRQRHAELVRRAQKNGSIPPGPFYFVDSIDGSPSRVEPRQGTLPPPTPEDRALARALLAYKRGENAAAA